MSMSVSEYTEEDRRRLKKRCLECWRLAGYCKDAPFMYWYETCEHLDAIGDEIRLKLEKQRKFIKEK